MTSSNSVNCPDCGEEFLIAQGHACPPAKEWTPDERETTGEAPPLRIPDQEFCELLERNGYPAAAERIAAGETQEAATSYIVGRKALYNDGEGQWLQNYINALAQVTPKLSLKSPRRQ